MPPTEVSCSYEDILIEALVRYLRRCTTVMPSNGSFTHSGAR